MPAASCALAALTVTITVPSDAMPLTATVYVVPLLGAISVITAVVAPAVPLKIKPVISNPVTGSLNTTVKLIGEAFVGSA